MNIYLIPYTWIRHIAVALVLGATSLLTWWVTLVLIVKVGPALRGFGLLWWQSADGLLFLGNVAGMVAFMSLFLEGALRRRPMLWRVLFALVAGVCAGLLTAISYGLIAGLYGYIGGSESMAILKDSSLVSLRYRLPMWWFAGLSCGMGAFVARRGQGVMARYGYGLDNFGVESDGEVPVAGWGDVASDGGYHLMGGLVASGFGAAAWHFCGMYTQIQVICTWGQPSVPSSGASRLGSLSGRFQSRCTPAGYAYSRQNGTAYASRLTVQTARARSGLLAISPADLISTYQGMWCSRVTHVLCR